MQDACQMWTERSKWPISPWVSGYRTGSSPSGRSWIQILLSTRGFSLSPSWHCQHFIVTVKSLSFKSTVFCYHNLFLRVTLAGRRSIPDTISSIAIFRHVWSTSHRKTRTEKLQCHFRSGYWGRSDSASNRGAPYKEEKWDSAIPKYHARQPVLHTQRAHTAEQETTLPWTKIRWEKGRVRERGRVGWGNNKRGWVGAEGGNVKALSCTWWQN